MAHSGVKYSPFLKGRIIDLHDAGKYVVEIEAILTADGEQVSWKGIKDLLTRYKRIPRTNKNGRRLREATI